MQGPDIFVLRLNRAGGALSQRSEFDVLDDPNVMIHLDGTYDTYQCKDCNIVLSALKRGDPGFEEHLWHGGGQCRYFRIKYVGREGELTISKGKLRFQRGFLALPQFIFSAINGYVPIGNTRHCIVCASPDYQHHNFQSACAEMARRIIVSLKHLTLDVHIDNTPLFSPLRRINNFSVLGESANMYHIPGIFGELPVDDKGDKVTSMSVLAHSIFADGAANWGRIVSLVAFGVIVCQNSNKEEEEERLALVESVGEEISTYLLTDQRDWLLKNNSWVGFVEFFAEPQHVLKDALLCIAGFTGIGALIYFV
ncbi:hypothetical protein D5F01_LYC24479 [Larimichthys crocea]|uniref:Bcl-2 Bcl-2 homology region 1-3 domain-containing protein n=1 Tax=Larimichthys crocea TaxID=215358 RepID=A0A6G0HE85_LARCR|nr:hypothetical protein D5F01_LYC24479 [Larimichthys crocea]